MPPPPRQESDTEDWPDWGSEPPSANTTTGLIGNAPRPPSTRSFDPWRTESTRGARSNASVRDYGDDDDVLESAELAGDDLRRATLPKLHYAEGSTIDWDYEEAADRIRKQAHKSERGLRRILRPLWDWTRLWTILILTGVGVGAIGAYLDILVAWLNDLKKGVCDYSIFYTYATCCTGLDPLDDCTGWLSWSQKFGINSWFLSSITQYIFYIVLGVTFATSAAVLVRTYAPYAFHTGIPEIKAILGGYVLDAFLSPWTLLIKGLGLALSVASGLSLGKEGPLVHVSCCLAFLLLSISPDLRNNEAQKRKILASAAAAGVSVAFGSPLGAVIFGLEELELFTDSHVIWRAFVTSVVAAVSLQYIDPFGTKKLVLFQIASNELWRAFELIPFAIIAMTGGYLGSLLIKLNTMAAVYRKKSFINQWPLAEVAVVAALTAFISYPISFMEIQSSSLVAHLFQECDPNKDFLNLCNPNRVFSNVFLLLLTAAIKLLLTAWTFGIQVPAGIFLPSIAIGASLGRAAGLIMQSLHRNFPMLWIFAACPPDPTSRCISPGFYSVVGASAMLGGVTRMTVSLVVIIFEMTGALSHVLPIMGAVMVSKWTADAFGKEGIYAAWIQLRKYPSIPSTEYRDQGVSAEKVMIPMDRIFAIRAYSTIVELEALMDAHPYHGFPIVDNGTLIGYVTRERLLHAIALLDVNGRPASGQCSFIDVPEASFEGADLSGIIDEAPMQMRPAMPLEIVTSTFQKMNLRTMLFTVKGRLVGMLTKQDIVHLMTNMRLKGALMDESLGR